MEYIDESCLLETPVKASFFESSEADLTGHGSEQTIITAALNIGAGAIFGAPLSDDYRTGLSILPGK